MNNINTFIVIGAGSPVGSAVSAQIAKNPNARLLMTTRPEYDFCKTLTAQNPERVSYHSELDFAKRSDLDKLSELVPDFTQGDRYAVIVSTSYFTDHKPFIETSYDEAEEIRKANVDVPVNIVRTLIPHMLANNGGHFIGFSCQSVSHNYPYMADFTAAKTMLNSYMRTWANEHGTHGLQFNNFALSSVKTDFTVNSKPNGDTDNYITPSEVADEVVEFAERKNSLLQNGQTLSLFKRSAVDHSRKGWADRIMTPENETFVKAFLDWQPRGGDFPRTKDFPNNCGS